MASSNPPSWLTKIFNELFAIRNSLQLIQQRLNTMDKKKRNASSDRSVSIAKKPRSLTPAQPSRYRQLVDQAYNQPAKPKICWYHRVYGAAANPANCNNSCEFVPPAKVITKPAKKKSSNDIQPVTKPNEPLPPPNPLAPWTSPDSVKSDLLMKIRSSRLSDSSSDSEFEQEKTISNPKGE